MAKWCLDVLQGLGGRLYAVRPFLCRMERGQCVWSGGGAFYHTILVHENEGNGDALIAEPAQKPLAVGLALTKPKQDSRGHSPLNGF